MPAIDLGVWLAWAGMAGKQQSHKNPQINRSYLSSLTVHNNKAFHFRGQKNHFGGLVSGRRVEEPRQRAWTTARQSSHFEGHWTSVEWLRVNNIWSPVTQIPIRTSTMKHLPIKSNDACDSRGIMVKWCIQPDYGHLQMASVQENAESFSRPYWHKARGWTRDVFGHQYELNALRYRPLNPFIIACAAMHLCLSSWEITGSAFQQKS